MKVVRKNSWPIKNSPLMGYSWAINFCKPLKRHEFSHHENLTVGFMACCLNHEKTIKIDLMAH